MEIFKKMHFLQVFDICYLYKNSDINDIFYIKALNIKAFPYFMEEPSCYKTSRFSDINCLKRPFIISEKLDGALIATKFHHCY